MSINGTDSIGNRDTFAYRKMSNYLQETSLPESTANALHSACLQTQDPIVDEKVHQADLEKSTIHPGGKSAIVGEVAAMLTRVKNPLTGDYFLSPELFVKLPFERMKTLSGPILEAVRSFQNIYMGQCVPTGSLGPYECKRILTIDSAIMLTQLINPQTHKPYLNPTEFNRMPRLMQVKLSRKYAIGDLGNPIFEAFKNFLIVEKLQPPGTEETTDTIISKHSILQKKWRESLGHPSHH